MRINEIVMLSPDDVPNTNLLFNNIVSDSPAGAYKSVVGSIGDFLVVTKKAQQLFFFLIDKSNKKVVMACQGSNKYTGLFCIERIGVVKSHRGMQLPIKLYSFLIKKLNYRIVSDITQSVGGRSIWEKLMKVPGIDVVGYNTRSKQTFQIDPEQPYNNDVWSSEIDDEIADFEHEKDEVGKDSIKLANLQNKIDKLHKSLISINNIRLLAYKSVRQDEN
jgi:hypothetical protein